MRIKTPKGNAKGIECVADFTSIVICDDDWTPNHVEHVSRRKKITNIVYIADDPNIVGYLRIKTASEETLLVVAGDWGQI